MIIIKVMGGLGNQMQQYALYEKFRSMGKEASLDISWFEDSMQQENVLARRELELRLFDKLEFRVCTPKEKEALLGKGNLLGKVARRLNPKGYRHFQESDMYHPEIFTLTDCYLEGHWACEKYYGDILSLLREKIRFPYSLERNCVEYSKYSGTKAENYVEKLINSKNKMEKEENNENRQNKEGIIYEKFDDRQNIEKNQNNKNINIKNQMKTENSVSIHIRRGDYLDPANAGMFGGICTEEYYNSAERYIRERVKDAHFYLFSDDTAYLEQNYHGREYTIVDWNKGRDSFYDMELMSCCKHNICANSTFSFWGARLNGTEDKMMIRPARHKNGQEIDPVRMHELWRDWVLIDEKGKVI